MEKKNEVERKQFEMDAQDDNKNKLKRKTKFIRKGEWKEQTS